MTRLFATSAVLCLSTLLFGCPTTQVVVRVNADLSVREDPRFHHVRVVVLAEDGAERMNETAHGPSDVRTPWPFDVVLAPRDGDAMRTYRVIVTAENERNVDFVSSRVVSGYVPRETRILYVQLEGTCIDRLCGEDDGVTCRRGECVLSSVDPGQLPRLGEPTPDALVVPDAGTELDATFDAQSDAQPLDAQSDAQSDAPDLDAFVEGLDAPMETPDAWVAPLDAGPVFTPTGIEPITSGASFNGSRGASICCSHDGTFVAAAEPLGDHVGVWHLATGFERFMTPNWAVGCRPDGSEIVVGMLDTSLSVRAGASPFSEVSVPDALATVGDGLGGAVAVSASHAVVGARLRAMRGEVSILASDLRSVSTSLRSSDLTAHGDLFGFAVAISEDGRTVAVGAPHEDGAAGGVDGVEDEGAADAGAVFVFRAVDWSVPGTISETRIKAPSPVSNTLFGSSVALDASGTWLAVGAPGDDSLAGGAVFVYRRSGATWSWETTLVAPASRLGDQFGASVSWSDDASLLAVGAPLEDSTPRGLGSSVDSGGVDSGAAYLFRRLAGWSGLFVKAPDASAPHLFGAAVVVAGDGSALFVGAPSTFSYGETGAVYRVY